MGADRRLLVAAVLVATFLVGLDTTVISTAMPTVVGQLGGIGLYSWVFSTYLLTSTVTVPIYGKLADLYGRKPVFLAATALFLVGSMLCGQAQSMEQLIAFRFIQGLGAGGVQPITQTIIGDVFPLEQRARLTGVFAAIWGISALVGPGIGGFLTEQVSWRWVFYVNLPLCLLSMLLVWLFLHEVVERRAHSIDYVGALLLSGAVTALLFGLHEPTVAGVVLPGGMLVVLAAALFVTFVWFERRAPEPLLPLGLFRHRIIAVGTAQAALVGVVLFGQSSFVPPFVQGVMGATPTLTGFILASTSLGWPLASSVSGRLMLRWGYRRTGILGGLFLVAGFALLRRLGPDDSLLAAVASQGVIGAGFGFLVPLGMLSMQNAVGWEQRGVVTSTSQFARSIGGTIGVSLAGAVFAAAVASAPGSAGDPNQILSMDTRATLAPAQLDVLRRTVADSLGTVYTGFLATAVLALGVTALLPGGPAAEHAWQGSTAEEAAEPAAARG